MNLYVLTICKHTTTSAVKVLLHSGRRSCWTLVAIKLCSLLLRTADAFALEPRLQCLVLRDAAEPGFPSFCVLSAAHLTRFGDHLLPPGVFVNQDADPFLFELYRSCPGAVAALSTVTVTNKRGGSSLSMAINLVL